MAQYFYKIVDNVDFVWKVEPADNDPYKAGELRFGHYVLNEEQFSPYLFYTVQDMAARNALDGYTEIEAGKVNGEGFYYSTVIGLLHKDSYWDELHAVRRVNCVERLAVILFDKTEEEENLITAADEARYVKLMNCSKAVGTAVYGETYRYFKRLWKIDDYYSSTNLTTLEMFLPTLQLQSISLYKDEDTGADMARFSFRPSWDEEHGVKILLNLDTGEVTEAD